MLNSTILNTNMKQIVLVFAAVITTVSGFAQKTADIGIWGGTSSYWGDVRVPAIQSFNPVFGGIFRNNFNQRTALRLMFLTGKIAANGTVENVPWTFEKNVQDISAQIEINYLKYVLGDKKTAFTPYIMGGIGMMSFPYHLDPALLSTINPNQTKGNAVIEESLVTIAIPMGFGFKLNLGTRVGLGIEYQIRKILSDKLDDLDDPLSFRNEEDQLITYTDLIHNNDWPGFLGIHLTYKIYLGRKACPAYDIKHW
jgi:hypothetical protein